MGCAKSGERPHGMRNRANVKAEFKFRNVILPTPLLNVSVLKLQLFVVQNLRGILGQLILTLSS